MGFMVWLIYWQLGQCPHPGVAVEQSLCHTAFRRRRRRLVRPVSTALLCTQRPAGARALYGVLVAVMAGDGHGDRDSGGRGRCDFRQGGEPPRMALGAVRVVSADVGIGLYPGHAPVE